jgi:hypothetical protein
MLFFTSSGNAGCGILFHEQKINLTVMFPDNWHMPASWLCRKNNTHGADQLPS